MHIRFEMALEAKSKGAYVIAVTSKNHSDSVTSRHKSGKKLIDIADLVIDNCGVVGDCILQVPGLHEKCVLRAVWRMLLLLRAST